MNKDKKIYGIDISKDVFDIYNDIEGHFQLDNTTKGFKKLLKILPENALMIMEATGYYHYKLAQFLDSNNILVSVVNPLSVKRFIQMKLAKVKTDKSDAKSIYEYAIINDVPLYKSLTSIQSECLQLYRLLEVYIKKSTATKNKLHGESVLGNPSKTVYNSLRRNLRHLKKEMLIIEKELLSLVKQEHQEQLTLLQTIPGIGIKTALYLIITTNGFKKFETASQLCSYAGITPTIKVSGSSVRGRSRISKVGNSKLRKLLFLASFSAFKHNTACKALFNRLVAKGKSKKLALIAVCNKLLKQAFSIIKNRIPYDKNYRSTLLKN